jgi:hypothetical protein
MGYEYHIVRRANYEYWDEESETSETEWLASMTSNISQEEWLAYIENDPQLELSDEGKTESTFFCYWLGGANHKKNTTWFLYHAGSITAKYPTQEMLQKMIDIATTLNARVVSDDAVYHDEEGACFITAPKPWWRFW